MESSAFFVSSDLSSVVLSALLELSVFSVVSVLDSLEVSSFFLEYCFEIYPVYEPNFILYQSPSSSIKSHFAPFDKTAIILED